MPDEQQIRYAEANLRNCDAKIYKGFATGSINCIPHFRIRRNELSFLGQLVFACNLKAHGIQVETAAANYYGCPTNDTDILNCMWRC